MSGVADRARDRIQRVIYLDAFVLRDGQSLRDVCPPGMAEFLTDLARQSGDGWRTPSPFTMEQFGVSTPEDIAWNERGLVTHPLKTFVESVSLHPEPLPFPVSYVRFTKGSMGLFEPFAALAQANGWDYREVPWRHAAPAVLPDECAELLIEIAACDASSAAI